jgi:hypothetical protein
MTDDAPKSPMAIKLAQRWLNNTVYSPHHRTGWRMFDEEWRLRGGYFTDYYPGEFYPRHGSKVRSPPASRAKTVKERKK